jgi:hypothetical protein
MAEADLWPISDAWAYHDWHQSGNGDVAPFMKAMEEEFGAGTDLKDFERKAQMLDYTEHRAVFEGFNQHLWTPNSGRILWMTQPAWPSNMWQIMSSDYDTQSSFYGVKKACEPNHVQMDISDGTVAAVNTTRENLMAAFVRARVYSLDNRLLFSRELTLDVAADSTTTAFRLELDPLLATEHLLLVKLELLDRAGALRSSNLYWRGVTEASYRGLNALPAVHLESSAASSTDGENIVLTLHLANHASAAALAVKATLLDAATGQRILPAYLSDNYISLLPGESATITARYPAGTAKGPAKITLRGWNLADDTVVVP